MIEHFYATMKLINGDNILCVILGQEDSTFTVMYPMVMNQSKIEVNGKLKAIYTGSPWCQFTDESVFEIFKQDIITMNPMNESAINYYKSLVDIDAIDDMYEDDEEDIEFNIDSYVMKGNNTIN